MTTETVCYAGHPGFYWFPLVPVFFFGFWVVVFFVVRPWAWRRRGWGARGPWSPSGSAEAVLAERYARGEVTDEEYRARLEVLRADRHR